MSRNPQREPRETMVPPKRLNDEALASDADAGNVRQRPVHRATGDLEIRTKVSNRMGSPVGPTALMTLPRLPVKSKCERKKSAFALSKTTARSAELASICPSRSWSA